MFTTPDHHFYEHEQSENLVCLKEEIKMYLAIRLQYYEDHVKCSDRVHALYLVSQPIRQESMR